MLNARTGEWEEPHSPEARKASRLQSPGSASSFSVSVLSEHLLTLYEEEDEMATVARKRSEELGCWGTVKHYLCCGRYDPPRPDLSVVPAPADSAARDQVSLSIPLSDGSSVIVVRDLGWAKDLITHTQLDGPHGIKTQLHRRKHVLGALKVAYARQRAEGKKQYDKLSLRLAAEISYVEDLLRSVPTVLEETWLPPEYLNIRELDRRTLRDKLLSFIYRACMNLMVALVPMGAVWIATLLVAVFFVKP
jgi:hypothetical protein